MESFLSHYTVGSVSNIPMIIIIGMSSVGEVFHPTLGPTGNLTCNMPWYYDIVLLSLFTIILKALSRAYGTDRRDVPSLWQAKFTRLLLVRAISSRSSQKVNLDLHQKYGHSSNLSTVPLYCLGGNERKF